MIGSWVLRLWPKQMLDIHNWLDCGQDGRIYCTGTLIYRGLGYHCSMRSLLHDARRNRIDFDQVQGNFVVLFEFNEMIHILTDELNVGVAFIDQSYQRISS